jgi:hypothetical protein
MITSEIAATLRRDGAAVVCQFLNDGDARSLKHVVEVIYDMLASYAVIPDAELEQTTAAGTVYGSMRCPAFLMLAITD